MAGFLQRTRLITTETHYIRNVVEFPVCIKIDQAAFAGPPVWYVWVSIDTSHTPNEF